MILIIFSTNTLDFNDEYGPAMNNAMLIFNCLISLAMIIILNLFSVRCGLSPAKLVGISQLLSVTQKRATWSAPRGKSLKVYPSDLSSVEIECNVCRIRFANSGKNSILESILTWSGCRRSVKLRSECHIQPAVLPAHEELIKV